MFSRFETKHTFRRQQGNMLVMAMFAMVVLTLVGLTMANLLSASHTTIVNEVLGERAEQASRAGVEILAHAIEPVNDSTYYSCDSTFNLSRFNALEGMEGCNVVTRCTTTEYHFDGGRDLHYEVKATATCVAGDKIAQKDNTLSMTRRWTY